MSEGTLVAAISGRSRDFSGDPGMGGLTGEANSISREKQMMFYSPRPAATMAVTSNRMSLRDFEPTSLPKTKTSMSNEHGSDLGRNCLFQCVNTTSCSTGAAGADTACQSTPRKMVILRWSGTKLSTLMTLLLSAWGIAETAALISGPCILPVSAIRTGINNLFPCKFDAQKIVG